MSQGETSAVKLSTTLSSKDYAYLASYKTRHGLPSRAAAFHHALRALREKELEAEYRSADADSRKSGENQDWLQFEGWQ